MALIGLDTNILLRTFGSDDAAQTESVRTLITGRKPDDMFFVGLTVIVEVHWALSRFYKYPSGVVLMALRSLLERRDLQVEHFHVVGDAIALCEDKGCDFADAVIALMNRQNGCTHTVTFDKAAARAVPGMELLA